MDTAPKKVNINVVLNLRVLDLVFTLDLLEPILCLRFSHEGARHGAGMRIEIGSRVTGPGYVVGLRSVSTLALTTVVSAVVVTARRLGGAVAVGHFSGVGRRYRRVLSDAPMEEKEKPEGDMMSDHDLTETVVTLKLENGSIRKGRIDIHKARI